MKVKVGTTLFHHREERKLSQAEMAELIGVSQATYSRLERNETNADIDQIVSFSKFLGVPVQEFFPETMAVHYDNKGGYNSPNMVFGDFNLTQNTSPELLQALTAITELLKVFNEKLGK